MLKNVILGALLLPGFVYCAAGREAAFPKEKWLDPKLREKGPLFEACWQDDFAGVARHSEHIDETNSPDLLIIASHCCDGGACRNHIDGDSAHVKIMRLLLKKDCIHKKSVTLALYGPAIWTRCFAAVEVLIEHGADVNYAYKGRSMLHAAVLRDNEMTVVALLSAGANMLARDKDGLTPEERIARLPDRRQIIMKRMFDDFKRDKSLVEAFQRISRASNSDNLLS